MKIEQISSKTAKMVFDQLKLKEHSIYKVRVKVSSDNVPHQAILFTGFNNGSYCEVYNNSYEHPIKMMHCDSIEIIESLGVISKEKHIKSHIKVWMTKTKKIRAQVTEINRITYDKSMYEVTVGGNEWNKGKGNEYREEIRHKTAALIASLNTSLKLLEE